MEIKRVWIVEHGEHDNRGAVGVFTSAANAQTVCDYLNSKKPYTEASVSEWPLDPIVGDINRWIAEGKWE